MHGNALVSHRLKNTTSSEVRDTKVNYKIIQGDCREALKQVDSDSVHTCVTSPPYFGLRSYYETGVRLKPNLTDDQVVMVLERLNRLGVKPIC